MKVPPDLVSFLKENDNFFIATHISPEPDALGSSLALSMALESLGKKTIVYDRDTVPEFYRFLPGYEKFIHSTAQAQTSACNLILLDCNTPDRAGIDGMVFRSSTVIDHHETEKGFGDLRWIVPDAAATGMLIFSLIKELGTAITKDIAVNLYAAIAIDTGTFRYTNTTADVLRVAAELINAGAVPASISDSLYNIWSEGRFTLLIASLNTLDIRDGVAFTHVTQAMYQKTRTGPEDTENFANLPRTMKHIKVSAFFRQIGENYWKASLRSKGALNVAKIAVSFGGGGHRNAAGYTFKGNFEAAKEGLLKALRKSS
jgi:bifunctional oligoribonuclease and PAP phosphatase NrnA